MRQSVATELRAVLGQLLRRLRTDAVRPTSQLAVLSRLDRNGPQTTSGLAAAERMRPQSMAEIVAELQGDGLVERRPDAADRRSLLVELTQEGRDFIRRERRRREDWLSQAIAEEFTPHEQAVLAEAVALLRRLAELD
ncbi:MAG: MarR family transcriptional regulator [Acidobacteriota bacterium]|nr:MarR family transcriptional regulator [Acidobacteriota bacterium]MDE3190292.1 MarR family transcriptional regulator [Acidobacteriota bacterium]